MKLVLVESPTKARTLSRFLPKEYRTEATYGHMRDLPEKELGVDVDKRFAPKYVIVPRSKKRVGELRRLARGAGEVVLATDPDREGEAIAYHAAVLLKGELAETKFSKNLSSSISPGRLKRIVFHEITKSAIENAVNSPRGINMDLVDAQQARRVLDRLVGYKLSPLLWKKVKRGLSAGRVQSVAVRLIVEREREREAFRPVEYWEVFVELEKENRGDRGNRGRDKGKDKGRDMGEDRENLRVKLEKIDGKKAEIGNEKEAAGVVTDLKAAEYRVDSVEKKEARRGPYPPFTTSTLQQTAARLMRWSGKKTMMHAQKLYERGLITYHRTDSVALAADAIGSVRNFIGKEYGKQYLPEKARGFKTKSKLAQEAHEAIRVTEVGRRKAEGGKTGRDDGRLYDLIWRRFVACQMAAAVFDRTRVDVMAERKHTKKTNKDESNEYLLRARGEIEKFDGWRRVYERDKGRDKGIDKGKDKGQFKGNVKGLGKGEVAELPEVAEGERLEFVGIDPQQKFTQPPARYSEAGLIKKLEAEGIGRPSTYAPIVATIQERVYVEKEEGRFFPTKLGTTVNDFLVGYFPGVLDLKFTAKMEDDLDEIAKGKGEWRGVLRDFYAPFAKKLEKATKTADRVKVPVEKIGEKCPDCKKGELIIRIGKFGKFIACDKFPKCKYSRNYVEKAGVDCPECGAEMVIKYTKKRKRFYGCSRYPDCKFAAWKKSKIIKHTDTTDSNTD